MIFKFIWKNKKDKINRKVMFQDYDDGGICAPSKDTMSKSLKLAWISRFLINDQMCSESWKVISNYYFDKYGGLRAAVPKYRLEVCKMKKSKIPKLCQDIGLGKLFLKKKNFQFD